jgi:hypothetical protein
MLASTSGTAAFFKAMALVLTSNILTVTLVFCVAAITKQELRGEEGRLAYLWLVVLVLLFMLYGLYTWRIYPFGP